MTEDSKPLPLLLLDLWDVCLDALWFNQCSGHIPTLNENLFGGNASEMVYYLPR